MCFGIIMWFCGISKLTESTIHEAVKFSHLYFYANNIFFVRIIQLLMIKPVIIIAQLFIAFILFLFRILLSIGHVLWKMVIWILLFIWKVFSGLFDLLLRSYGNFSLIVLNFYSETYRVPAIYSKIEGTYLPNMGAYKKKLGASEMRELRQRTIEKQSPNPVKEHIIQTDENRKRLYRV